MRIPLYLEIVQWTLLLTFGLLLLTVYRQLGRAFSRPKSDTDLGPPIDSRAADVEYTRVGEVEVRRITPGDGHAALVAFVDPTCPACETLVSALGTAAHAGELSSIRVLLLISDPPSYLQISEAFRQNQLEIGQIVARATIDSYRAFATPLLVAIDGNGVVRSAGPAHQIQDVRAFARACLSVSDTQPPIIQLSPRDESRSDPDPVRH